MSGNHRTCEICGIQEKKLGKKLFYAKFPLKENSCKEWVRVVGKEDLAHLPIEKLHSSRYVCGMHFKKRDFTKTGKKLKKRAVPHLLLSSEPLADELLVEFPLHVASYGNDPYALAEASREVDLPSEFRVEEDNIRVEDDHTGDTEGCDPTSGIEECTEIEGMHIVDEGPYSWQKFSEEVDAVEDTQSPEDDVTFCGEAQLVPDVCNPVSQTEEDYSCNVCLERIAGFRYACVQCCDWDLCSACEARGEHSTHYVLRIPPEKTHSETQSVLAALRQMLTNILLHEPAVELIKEEVKEEDPLLEADVPLEPSEVLTQADIVDTHQVQEVDSITLGTEDEDTHTETSYDVPSSQKRKMPPHADIHMTSLKKQKLSIQTADSAKKSYSLTSAVQKQSGALTTSAMQNKVCYVVSTAVENDGMQIDEDQVIFLDSPISDIIMASNNVQGHNMQIFELPSSSTSDNQYMVLECFKELRVNMTKLSNEEILSATRQSSGNR